MMLFYVVSMSFYTSLSIFVSQYLIVILLPHVEMSKHKHHIMFAFVPQTKHKSILPDVSLRQDRKKYYFLTYQICSLVLIIVFLLCITYCCRHVDNRCPLEFSLFYLLLWQTRRCKWFNYLIQCGVLNCGLIYYSRIIFNMAVLNSPSRRSTDYSNGDVHSSLAFTITSVVHTSQIILQ